MTFTKFALDWCLIKINKRFKLVGVIRIEHHSWSLELEGLLICKFTQIQEVMGGRIFFPSELLDKWHPKSWPPAPLPSSITCHCPPFYFLCHVSFFFFFSFPLSMLFFNTSCNLQSFAESLIWTSSFQTRLLLYEIFLYKIVAKGDQ